MTIHDMAYFENMLEEIRKELLPQIPVIDQNLQQQAQHVLAAVMTAQSTRDAAKKAQERAKQGDEKKACIASLQDAEEELTQALDTALETCAPLLHHVNEALHNDSSLFVKCSVLSNAGKQLAEYSQKGEEQSKRVQEFLSDTSLLRDMLFNGGAKGNHYGQAFEIYSNILPHTGNNEVLQRLALGTALEHAVPIQVFDVKKEHINPLERFLHYKQAFLNKELDPKFATMTAWEMRYVSDSDATDDQLAWGRRMLRNYRPDIMETRDYTWRYCMIVRTDVKYDKPNWTSQPRTYDQMMNAGGMCGPRAWFGRFACKMFGIPTWGVRQPGHAAVGHWTPHNGWVTVLGSAWKWSWWEDREGTDFCLEAQAREQGDDYMTVCCLEWVADALGEKPIHGKVNPHCLWQSLSLLQKHRLAKITETNPACKDREARSIIDENGLDHTDEEDQISFKDDGAIIIPAVACNKPNKQNRSIIFMKSFLGGKQLHIENDHELQYTLTFPFPETAPKEYQLSIKVVTVHDKMSPLILTTGIESASCKVCKDEQSPVETVIAIPYTKGEFQMTAPVFISLGSSSNVLTFKRKTPDHGLTIKELLLSPINAESVV
jgi:hypothetical protein